jgi:short-subunit dehydrogenase
VYPLRADLGSYDGVEQLWQAVQEIGRPLDVAVLNAGVSIGGAFATDTDLDAELGLIAVNINAVVHLAKRVLPGMLARGIGRILITSSISATTPTPYETVYGPSKAFRLLLRRVAARRVARHRRHRHRPAARRHRQRFPPARRDGDDRHR